MYALMVNHMQQFTFNAAGALRWKADVAEYSTVCRDFQVDGLAEKIARLQVRWCCCPPPL